VKTSREDKAKKKTSGEVKKGKKATDVKGEDLISVQAKPKGNITVSDVIERVLETPVKAR